MDRTGRTLWLSLLGSPIALVVLAIAFAAASAPFGAASSAVMDVDLPSLSTGSVTGVLAVRIYPPAAGHSRYADGAPVIIWVPGGTIAGDLSHKLPPASVDVVIITFVFPGGEDPYSGRHSDGTYDDRGPNCTLALRDIILYAAGELVDARGRTIYQVVPVQVLHDNIGMIGLSNGGNIPVAVAAAYGQALTDHLRYIIQWETPVSSQIATRDLGRVWLFPPDHPEQGDFFNVRYLGYDPLVLPVDYADLAYDPGGPLRRIFHDGNGDGHYTTVEDPRVHLPSPDLNLDGVLSLDEDFPLDAYPSGTRSAYSRPVTHALADRGIITGTWPVDVMTPAEADAYWDLRESVRLYAQAAGNMPALEGMVLGSVHDHVQSSPDKPHIRQAFDGWNMNGLWVQINPSRSYVVAVDPALASRTDLPDNAPNTAPPDWSNVVAYCMPDTPNEVPDATYQLAAVWQMADRVHGGVTPTPTAALSHPQDVDRLASGNTLITDGGQGLGGVAGPQTALSQIVEVDPLGNVVWSFSGGLDFPHNADRLDNGHVLISDTGHDRVLEIDAAGNLTWSTEGITLSDGSHLSYPNDANWLPGDHILITDRDNHRIIEIERNGTIIWQFGQTGVLGSDGSHMDWPHNADRLANGNTVIADMRNNRIVEVDPAGTVIWQYHPAAPAALSWPKDADRLDNGNTLITDSHNGRVVEVRASGQVVWQYGGLSWIYDADRLVSGNTLISDSEDGRVIEVNPSKTIVWSYPPRGVLTPTPISTLTQTLTASPTAVTGPTLTSTATPTRTATVTQTPTPTRTETGTPVPTATVTGTSPTRTPTPTRARRVYLPLMLRLCRGIAGP